MTFPCSSCKEEEDHLHSLSSTGVSCIATLANLSVLDDVPERKTFISDERKTDITPSTFSELWQIGPKQAAQTLRVTTQRGVRSVILPLARRYCADRMYLPNCLCGQHFYTDTIFFTNKSIDGNTCAQVFANDSFFSAVYSMESKSMAGDALNEFISDFGAMDTLVMDGAAEQVGKRATMRKT